MKSGKSAALLGAVTIALSACATAPDQISPQYVSPARYAGFDCDQVSSEIEYIRARVSEVTGKQQDQADGDAVAMGVGLVLFWPALFFLIGDDQKEELARLKGEYEALRRVSVDKKCEFIEFREAEAQAVSASVSADEAVSKD